MRDDEHRPLGAQEGYWWRDARTDTLYVHSLMGFRLVLFGHSESLAGYAYGVGDLDPRAQRYGTVTLTRARRGAVPCAV
jgi:hypothetical protein